MSKDVNPGKRYELTVVDEGLTYLARAYGKSRKASRMMKEAGLAPVPPSTLDNWKKRAHPERYEQLRAEWEKRRDLDAAERMDALISRALDIEEDILDKTAEKMDRIDPRDLPNAYKNIAIGSGVLQDKSDRLKGKPAHVIEHKHDLYPKLELAIAALEREALEAETVDAEVVEIPEAVDDAVAT